MKQLTIIFFTFCLLTSCNKRVIHLPDTTNKNITEVIDMSPIYMFYNENLDSLEFNRRNMISSTNWLVNIDKRLTLKQILPHLQYLQEKRHGDGMHKNDNAKNYFSCNNTELKNLSFIEFTDIKYVEGQNSIINSKSEIYLNINEDGSLSSNTEISESIDSVENYFNSMTDYFKSNPEMHLILVFNENLTFQNYINIKTKILALDSLPITISNNEFIYN